MNVEMVIQFPNDFNEKRDTLLIPNKWYALDLERIEFNEINLYLDDIKEKLERYAIVKNALGNKYLKYKKILIIEI